VQNKTFLIVSHGVYHAPYLATELKKRGGLFAVISDRKKACPKGCRENLKLSYAALIFTVFRAFTPKRFNVVRRVFGIVSKILFDIDVSIRIIFYNKVMKNDFDVICWDGSCKLLSSISQKLGIVTHLNRGSIHPEAQIEQMQKSGFTHSYIDKKLLAYMVKRQAYEFCNATNIIVPSPHITKTFPKSLQHKIKVENYGIDRVNFPRRVTYNVDIRILKIVYAGGLTVAKGSTLLLGVLENLRREGYKFQFIHCGIVAEDLKQTIGSLDQNIYEFKGHLSPSELHANYIKSDIFVHPSYHEGQSLTVLQAIATGLPVLVSNMTGASHIVDEFDIGASFKAGDVNGLSKLIKDSFKKENLIKWNNNIRQLPSTKLTWSQHTDLFYS
jgi:hypothetical protein